jgi:hypothetical protein
MTITLGSIETFASYEVIQTRVVATGNRIFTLYIDKPSGDYGKGSLYSISGNTLSHLYTTNFGVSDQYIGATHPLSLCEINTNRLIYTYDDSILRIHSILVLVSTNTFSEAPGLIVAGGEAATHTTSIGVNTNKHVIAWCSSTNGVRAVCITTSGEIQTEGIVKTISGTATTATNLSVAKVSDDKFILTYYDPIAAKGKVVVCTISGTTITSGTPVDYESNLVAYQKVCCLDADKFVIIYDDRGTNYGQVIVGTITGVIPTIGTKVPFDTPNVGYCTCTKFDANHFLVAYNSDSVSHGYVNLCSVDWGTLTPTIGTPIQFESGSVGGGTDRALSICMYDADTFVISYQDDDDSDYGKIIAGNVTIIDPPTGISVTEGEGANSLIFVPDPLADSTNAYWSNSPGVTKLTGTKIAGITSPYNHTSLDPTLTYYYVFTSDLGGDESGDSSEYSASPYPISPSNVLATTGEAEISITFDLVSGATSYNIYWANSPGVTKLTGTKISGVTSPYAHTSLDPTLTYYYVVTSEDIDGESSDSIETSASPYPLAPTNLDYEVAVEFITLEWDASIGATSYNLYWKNSSGVTKLNGTKISGVSSPYVHSSLNPGLEYFYIVVAEDLDGESSESNEVNGIPHIATPQNPDVDLLVPLQLTISWDPVLSATSYNLYWLKTSGVTKLTGNKIIGVTSPYNHSGLDFGDTYYYVISAENGYEEGGVSTEVSSIIGDIPEAPENVTALATGIQEITIEFDSVLGASSYNIYWGLFTGINKYVANEIIGVTSPYIFTTPIADIRYYFFVTAENGLGESDESNEVNALAIPPIPEAPIDFVATSGDASINLIWSISAYADNYNVYWGDTPGVTQLTGTKISGLLNSEYSFIVPNLYQSYYFVVTAENESGESIDSLEVNAIPDPIVPGIPLNLEGETTASNQITLEWDTVTYAESYNIYWGSLPGVTKTNSSKIEGIIDLTKIIDGFIAGRTYYFAVAAVNPEGVGDLSEEISVMAVYILTGTQVPWIKATSEYNGVIVEWGNLEGADTYNLYWSKISPVSILTANKIENVTSPYRHYLEDGDPYYIVIGENYLGESDPSDEAFATAKIINFQSINFLPENLREQPLFMEFCSILDYVIEKYHYDNVDKLSGFHDVTHEDFDPEVILKQIGGDYFLDFDLNTDQKKALCLMLSNLYDMKGTKKGLDYIFRLLDLDATVYEWYDVNAGIYPEITDVLDPCEIILDLGLGDHPLLENEEIQFIALAEYLLWVCVKLYGIFWSKSFEDWFDGIEDEIDDLYQDEYPVDKYCYWTYNYTDQVIIGSPIDIHYVNIGEPGALIGMGYFEGELFLINFDVDADIDTELICEAHFIGEPDIYIGGNTLDPLTYEIDET